MGRSSSRKWLKRLGREDSEFLRLKRAGFYLLKQSRITAPSAIVSSVPTVPRSRVRGS